MRAAPLALLLATASATAFAVTPGFTIVHTTANRPAGVNPSQSLTLTHSTANSTGSAAAAQVETLTTTGTVTDGDVFSVTAGAATVSYTARNGDDATAAAAGLDLAIQGLPFYSSEPFTTSDAGGVITFTAKSAGTGFTLSGPFYAGAVAGGQASFNDTTVQPGDGSSQAQIDDAVVAGSVTPGDVFTFTFPGGADTVSYTANPGDGAAQVATGLASLIVSDPNYSSQNFTVSISSTNTGNDTIEFTGKGFNPHPTPAIGYTGAPAGGKAAVADSVQTANATGVAAVAQVDTVTAGTPVDAGDTFTVALPGSVNATYTAQPGDTPALVASGLSSAVQASTGYAGQAFTTSANGADVTFTAKTAGTGFTLGGVSTNNGTAVAQMETLTPVGVIPNEDYKVVVGGKAYDYITNPGDTATTVVSALQSLVNADGTAPASASGGSSLVLTSKLAGNPFTISASASVDSARVPALSDWAMFILSGLMGLAGVAAIRMRRGAASGL